MAADLIKPFSEQEIELVIHSLPRNKALRPMDIQAMAWGSTHFAPIPTVTNPKTFKDDEPISVCDTNGNHLLDVKKSTVRRPFIWVSARYSAYWTTTSAGSHACHPHSVASRPLVHVRECMSAMVKEDGELRAMENLKPQLQWSECIRKMQLKYVIETEDMRGGLGPLLLRMEAVVIYMGLQFAYTAGYEQVHHLQSVFVRYHVKLYVDQKLWRGMQGGS
ncbi:hypothetical protein QJS10_CPB22g00670 [Acorus calamus]|uniref:Uncharacterized protein n=1 Tax=Acorus calamus TaxID=4465 RepID=A0AAV9C1N4_ACOCL|nr:hypothetical protein QJS10_CPB22g00670 [Acorus calamus]